MKIKNRSLVGGEVFKYLTVIGYSHSIKRKDGKAGERIVDCVCKCGTRLKVRTSNLNSGNTQSCGCYHTEQVIKSNLLRKEMGYVR